LVLGRAAGAGSAEKQAAPPVDGLFVAAAGAVTPVKDPVAARISGTARVLGQANVTDEARQGAIQTLLQERDRAGDVLLGCLDFRKVSEPEVRCGALKGLRVVKPTGPRVSPALAWSAVMDPATEVRTEAVQAIKERKDDEAVGAMMRHLLGAFDEQGNVVSAPVRDAAVSALRSVNDRRVAETILRYCTMEIRTSRTEFKGMETLYITVPMVYSPQAGAGGTVVWVSYINLPIQFPTLAIDRVRTTVCCPAAALRALTGQDFGTDTQSWLNWIRSH
jgi:Arc/MetJ family transcription regulator